MKQVLLVLSFLFLIIKNGSSQTIFSQISENQVAQTSQGAFGLADIDGDNDQDLLVTGNYFGTYIAKLYTNNGSGVFSEIQSSLEGVSLSSVAFADIDGDNDKDVLIIGNNNSFTRVTNLYTNDGNGNYTKVNNTPFIGVNRGAIAFGDIDNDNDQDLIISGEIGANRLTKLYKNDGSGNFSEVLNPGLAIVNVGEIIFEDIDNDTDLDLLITGSSDIGGITYLYNNDGAGNFNLIADFDGLYFSSLGVADIDNDTDKDILISGISNNGNYITKLYTNNGFGNFSQKSGLPFLGVAYGTISFADIDNDNDQDVFISGLINSGVSISNLYYNDGNGNFVQDNLNTFPIVNDNSKGFTDLDNDGDQDLIIIGKDNNNINSTSRVYLNDLIPLDTSNHPDYNALVALYNSTQGDNWINNTNWLDITKPISSWYGITETNGRVTSIDLNNNRLLPVLPPEIGNLEELVSLEIFNEFNYYGAIASIPVEIGNLKKLQYIDLRAWGLMGEIPKELGSLPNLYWIDLRFNSLTGTIPNELTNLANLSVLIVSGNQLNGAIPNFSNLAALNYLWLDNNSFQFGDLEPNFNTYTTNSNLSYIYAPQNLLGERVDEVVAIGGNIALTGLNISGAQNSYTWSRINADGSEGGVIGNSQTINITINSADDYKWSYFYEINSNLIPGLTIRSRYYTLSDLPSNSPDYDALVAIYNSTNGDSWTNNTNWLDNTKPLSTWHGIYELVNNRVTNLDLGSNNLTGSIPSQIGDLTELKYLSFFINDLTGEIPPEIWNLSKMESMFLGAQVSKQLRLTGGIPSEISNMQELDWLNLTHVPLTQPLQPELFLLPKLTKLRIVECGLTGTLPKELALIDNVLASGNEFEGAIPDEIINSSGNSNLQIQNNYFDFSDLEPLVMANNYASLGYTPQRTKDVPQTIETTPGSNITLNIDDPRHNKTLNYKQGLGDEYQWYKDNLAITGANESTYTITNAQESDSGTYFCEITNNLVPDLIINRANITITIDAALSSEEINLDRIKIYPNPTKNILNITLDTQNNANANLFDVSGRLVLEKKLKSKTSQIDINHLNDGIYLLKIVAQNKTTTKRIVKQ